MQYLRNIEMKAKEIMTRKEVAGLFGYSLGELDRRRARSVPPRAHVIGRRALYLRKDVLEWANSLVAASNAAVRQPQGAVQADMGADANSAGQRARKE